MKKTRRVLGLLLTLVFMFAFLVQTVFAAEASGGADASVWLMLMVVCVTGCVCYIWKHNHY